jgi:hypothetical protein
MCLACKVRRSFEEHSLIGQHLPPRLITETNRHAVLSEAQRILDRVLVRGCRTLFVANLLAWLALELAALGSLEPCQ